MNSSHRIETLSWEARFSHARLAQTQQEQLSQFIHKHALPRLAERFDALSPPGEVWALEQLEVDMGRLRIQDSPAQWLQQFDQALQRSLAALQDRHGRHRAQARAGRAEAEASAALAGPRSQARHELGHFLHYLQHGLLPWGMPLRSARDLAGWLERLALQHGNRLWQALQQLMPPEPVLARLARIAPHQGLQALLAVRHRDLAEAFVLIDDSWLLPLQRRGRLSAYQVQSLQQGLRVAGLHALWGLSGGALGGARQRRLLSAMQASHAELLGPGWSSLRRALRGQVLPRQPGSELAAAMLAALLGEDRPGAAALLEPHAASLPPQSRPETQSLGPHKGEQAAAQMQPQAGSRAPSRLSQAALQRMQTWVAAWARGQVPVSSSPALGHWLTELQRRDPQALRQSLLEQLQLRSGRRAWSQVLPLEHRWSLLALLAGGTAQAEAAKVAKAATAGPAPRPRPAPPQWADSLRQTAAQLLQSCPARERPGLSAMQALLMEASLAHLLTHGRLPSTHSAWLALWHGAWAAWQGQAEDRPRPTRPAASSGRQARHGSRPAASAALHSSPDLAARVARWQPPTESSGSGRSDEARVPAWPAAALRRWLWQEAEALLAASTSTDPKTGASPGEVRAALAGGHLEAHWRRRWLQLHQPLHAPPIDGPHVPVHETESAAAPALAPTRTLARARQFQALWLQCQARAYGPAQRLHMAKLMEDQAACQDWCRQFDEDQRWTWLSAQFGPAAAADLRAGMAVSAHSTSAGQAEFQPKAAARTALAAQMPPLTAAPLHRPQLWPQLCEHLFVRGGPPDAAAFLHHCRAEAAPTDREASDQPQARNAAAARAATPREAPSSARAAAASRPPSSPLPSPAPSPTHKPTHSRMATTAPAEAPAPPLPGPLAAPIWVEDAGQVLLAAYAERLFKHLGLIADGQFVDAQARARGVLCLQGLVHGELPSSEPLWPLSKLLCGVPPHELLPHCEPLTAEEHALLQQLLAAVISHWKAIGNTSVAGLRESFLQREGRLERQRAEHGEPPPWRLKVQPRAFDMLLDRLPWGFSIIKLPWMQGVLHVEWR